MEIENIVPCRQRNTFNWFFLSKVFSFFLFLFLLGLVGYVSLCIYVWICNCLFSARFVCVCEWCVLHISRCAVVHFSMHDVFYSKYLYVISAAQTHTGKVRHQLVFPRLITASSSTLGTVDCIPTHINDALSVWWPPIGQIKCRAILFFFFNCTSNYYGIWSDCHLILKLVLKPSIR